MTKRLYRSKSERMISDVCGGIGVYFDVDPTIIRLAWIIASFCAGGGIFAYIIALIVIPSEKKIREQSEQNKEF